MPKRKSEVKEADQSVQILQGIWSELKSLNTRIDRTREDLTQAIDQTNQRLDQTNQRLDKVEQAVESLGRRQSETEIRLATEIVAATRAVIEVKDLLKDRLDLRDRVEDHERRLIHLEHAPTT